MADLNDYWFAAKQAFSERSFAAFGETIKAIERDRNSEDSRRESDLLKMSASSGRTVDYAESQRKTDISTEVDIPRFENTYKPTQSQQYKDEQAFYAKHDPVTQQQRDAAWAAAPSSGPSERRDEVVTNQMVMKL